MKGHVYVIKTDDGLVKIGATQNVKARVSGIRCKVDRTAALAYDTGPIDDFGAVERLAQRALSTKVVRGEWFKAEVQDAVQAVESARLEASNNNEHLSHYGRPLIGQERVVPVQLMVLSEQHAAAKSESEKRKISISEVYREWIEKGRKRR